MVFNNRFNTISIVFQAAVQNGTRKLGLQHLQNLPKAFNLCQKSKSSSNSLFFLKYPQTPAFCDLVSDGSVIVFQRLDLSQHDIHFLTYSKDKWFDFGGYKKLKMFISNLKVVNDVTERVRLMEEFEDILTNNEEQRKMLLHCVEDSRKRYPDFTKNQVWLRNTKP